MVPDRLPAGAELVRITETFDEATVPRGLLRTHRVATGTWGRIVVSDGCLCFVWEDDGSLVELAAGDSLVIPPDTPHRVEMTASVRFAVEFYTAVGA
ncbi:MAG: tellurite resistance protein [Acidimicrobiaceae bacterium]|nr:tellurite resistance protein [Acidimicrobiaceae bacterium]